MAGYADELSLKLSAKDEMSARLKDVKKELTAVEKQMVTARREFENTGAPEAAADMRRLEKEYERLHAAQRELAKSSTQVKKDLDQIRAKAGQSTSAAHKLGGAWMKASNVFKNNVVAGISAVGIALAGREALRQYGAAEKMQASLQFAYQKFPAIADVNIEAMRDLNTEIMNRTGADDDALASAEATLAMFQLTGVEITKLIPLVNDYAIKTGTDVPSSAEAIGKALMGNAKAMKSLGIDYKATGDRSKDLAFLMDALEEKVGGVGDAFGETTQGGLKIAEENFGNLQETVGQTLVPALTALVSIVKPLSEWFQKLPEPVRTVGVGIAALGTAALIATPRLVAMKAAMNMAGIGGVAIGKGSMKAAAGIAAVTTAFLAWRAASADDEGNVFSYDNAYAADEYGRALRDIVQPGAGGAVGNFLAGITDVLVPHNTVLEDAKTRVSEYDKKLSDMVASGNADGARAQFDSLARGAAEWGGTVDDIRQLLPGYQAALDATRTSTSQLDQSQDNAVASAKRLNRALGRLDRTLARREAVKGFNTALTDFIKKPSAEAGAALDAAMSDAAKTFKDPKRQAEFVKTSIEKIRDAANNSNLSAGIKTQIKSPLRESYQEALKLLGVLQQVATLQANSGSRNSGAQTVFKAAGGAVFGPGSGTSDSIPAMLSNGEYVIREAAARAIGYDQLDRLNIADRMPSLPAIVNAPAITISNPGGIGRDAPLIAQANFYPTGQVDLELALAREARRQERDQRTRYAGSRRP